MFGWLSTTCPLDTYEKTWTEWRMCWLADRLGVERLLQAEVLLPTSDRLPATFRGSLADVRRLMRGLGDHMGVGTDAIRLEVCPDDDLPSATGEYHPGSRGRRTTIRIAESQLDDPPELLATLAHELSHEILIGGGLIAADVPDHEWITDLVPAFLGAGVFAANATVGESSSRWGRSFWWSMSKRGYLPSRIHGYALALFLHMRGERQPAWTALLRPDAAEPLARGLRYLQKTGDSLFLPETIRSRPRPASLPTLVDRLRDRSASFRLAALWDLRGLDTLSREAFVAVMGALDDSDPAVVVAATEICASRGAAAADAVPELVRMLSSSRPHVRAGAADALGSIGSQPEVVVPELCHLLDDADTAVVEAAIRALTRFGHRAAASLPQLLDRIADSAVRCDHALADALAVAIVALSPDPRHLIDERFGRGDPEVLRAVRRTVGGVSGRRGHRAPLP